MVDIYYLYKYITRKICLARDYKIINQSKWFDKEWYLIQNPDVRAGGVDPICHFLEFGSKEGRCPFPGFQPFEYISRYPEIQFGSVNPLVHFISSGNKKFALDDWFCWNNTLIIQGSGMFDEKYYIDTYPDIKTSSMTPIEHYFYCGWKEGNNPSPTFDSSQYLYRYPDIKKAGINPLLHYIVSGKIEGRIYSNDQLDTSCVLFNKSQYIEKQSFEHERTINITQTDIKIIAFYLPQFHIIPENDKWWGQGFTDWVNVKKSYPLYDGHNQPRKAHSDIGYYDLSDWREIKKQSELAKRHGIFGFCFYHYWFHGKRLLSTPVDNLLDHPEIDINFCLCWANENWTRRWDGLDNDILISQKHSDQDDMLFIQDISKYFDDPRYIKIEDRPLLFIYRPSLFPNIKVTIQRWRKWSIDNGYGDLHLVASQAFDNFGDPRSYGFDAAYEFPPNQTDAYKINMANKFGQDKTEKYKLFSYSQYVDSLIKNDKWNSKRAYEFYRCVMLAWDNTPRKGENGAHIFFNFSFDKYKKWLKKCIYLANKQLPEDRRIVFINAWNEWAEGTYLEPDTKYGYRAINIIGEALSESERFRKPQRKETLVFISDDVAILQKITHWFLSYTAYNIVGIIDNDERKEACENDMVPSKPLNENADIDQLLTKNYCFFIYLNTFLNKPQRGVLHRKVKSSGTVLNIDKNLNINAIGYMVLNNLRDSFDLKPHISIIVPNYNHSNFLVKRLNSIFEQTFKDIEVILLDDDSSDGSRDVLNQYLKKYSYIARSIYSESNSGNVFKQWKKGIDDSRAELVWIAESDDYADIDMLEKLLPYFCDRNIKIAYCSTEFVDSTGELLSEQTKSYLFRTGYDKWKSSYVETSHKEVNDVLGVMNTIPNVSAVVFRKPEDTSFIREMFNYKLCGDWYFYLEIMRGWKIAYCSEAKNYFRLHDTGVTRSIINTNEYYEEHEKLFVVINQKYKVSSSVGDRYFEQLELVKNATMHPIDIFRIKQGAKNLLLNNSQKILNILVVSQGMFLGGGEILPIYLANELRKKGHTVIFLSLDVYPRKNEIEILLSKDVPIYTIKEESISNKSFSNFISSHGIDLINSHGHGSDLFVLKNLNKNDIPWVITMHGGYELVLSNENKNNNHDEYVYASTCLRRQLKRVDKWIYIADKNLAPFKKHISRNKTNFVKIANGFRKSKPKLRMRDEIGISEDAFVLCCATRAIPEKGWNELIILANIINSTINRELHLLLLGDGQVYNALCKSSQPSYVHLLGYKPNVSDYFAMSNLGVLLSYYSGESSPLCLIECLSTNRPFLATDVGECRRMLTDENGDLAGAVFSLEEGYISFDIINIIAKWVIDLIEDEELYKELCLRAESAFKQFEISNVADMYLETFYDVVS